MGLIIFPVRTGVYIVIGIIALVGAYYGITNLITKSDTGEALALLQLKGGYVKDFYDPYSREITGLDCNSEECFSSYNTIGYVPDGEISAVNVVVYSKHEFGNDIGLWSRKNNPREIYTPNVGTGIACNDDYCYTFIDGDYSSGYQGSAELGIKKISKVDGDILDSGNPSASVHVNIPSSSWGVTVSPINNFECDDEFCYFTDNEKSRFKIFNSDNLGNHYNGEICPNSEVRDFGCDGNNCYIGCGKDEDRHEIVNKAYKLNLQSLSKASIDLSYGNRVSINAIDCTEDVCYIISNFKSAGGDLHDYEILALRKSDDRILGRENFAIYNQDDEPAVPPEIAVEIDCIEKDEEGLGTCYAGYHYDGRLVITEIFTNAIGGGSEVGHIGIKCDNLGFSCDDDITHLECGDDNSCIASSSGEFDGKIVRVIVNG